MRDQREAPYQSLHTAFNVLQGENLRAVSVTTAPWSATSLLSSSSHEGSADSCFLVVTQTLMQRRVGGLKRQPQVDVGHGYALSILAHALQLEVPPPVQHGLL